MGLEKSTSKKSSSGSTIRSRCNELPLEILGRIFSQLTDEERCQIIPSVSCEFLAAHSAHPPVRTHWVVRAQPGGFTKPMATWLLAIAPSLEHLALDAGEKPWERHTMGCLSELLTAATQAPKLRELRVQCAPGGRGLFTRLSNLSQVKMLHLDNWWFFEAERMETEMKCLAGMTSLEEVVLKDVYWSVEGIDHARTLWGVLASLKNLNKQAISLSYFKDSETGLDSYFHSVSNLTGLRSLCIDAAFMEFGHSQAAAMGTMVHLTSLKVVKLEWNATTLDHVLGLPHLKDLHIGARESIWEPEDVSLSWKSSHLTSLAVDFGVGCDPDASIVLPSFELEDYFPLEAAPLARLQSLALLNWGILETFPSSLAAALSRLLRLEITGTCMRQLPPAVAEIVTLRELSLEGNFHLQLREEDIDTLLALPDLRVLRVSKKPTIRPSPFVSADKYKEHFDRISFAEESVRVLLAIRRRLPLLKLQGPEES